MKIFISHASEDDALARKLTAVLENTGFDVWNDEREIMPGDNWAEKIARALRDSDAMVVLLTSNALRSTTVRRDIDYALSEKKYNKRLIPVVIGDADTKTKIPWILKKLQLVELSKTDNEKDMEQVAKLLLDVA